MRVDESRVAVPGAALYTRVRAHGPVTATLLGVHGGPGISHETLQVLDDLAGAGLSVALYDQRATGRSSGQVDGRTLVDQSLADLAAVDRALSVGRLHLLGHAWGGLIAALYAARNPDRVASLILVDSIPPTAAELDAAMVHYGARLRDFQARGLVPADLPRWCDDAAGRLLSILPMYFADPAHPAARTMGGARLSPAVYEASRHALSTYDVRGEVARVAHPSLHFIAHVPFGPRMAAMMADAMTASPARRVRLRDAGHLVFAERPGPFLTEVARFLGDRHGQ